MNLAKVIELVLVGQADSSHLVISPSHLLQEAQTAHDAAWWSAAAAIASAAAAIISLVGTGIALHYSKRSAVASERQLGLPVQAVVTISPPDEESTEQDHIRVCNHGPGSCIEIFLWSATTRRYRYTNEYESVHKLMDATTRPLRHNFGDVLRPGTATTIELPENKHEKDVTYVLDWSDSEGNNKQLHFLVARRENGRMWIMLLGRASRTWQQWEALNIRNIRLSKMKWLPKRFREFAI
jgi:hypothetical protein